VAATGEESAIPGWRELVVSGLARTTAGLLLMESLVAVQVLVTVAVLPAVVSDLGGVRLYGAALSAPQVATVVVLPFTPRLVQWWGLRGAFYASVGAFLAGGLLVISAPQPWIFVSGLVVQGAGSGAQYALLLAVFTRRYPLRLRPRMYAALAVAWAIPGLVGPGYGGLVASTLGWRWAFALIVPLVVPAVWMLHPSLEPDGRGEPSSHASPARTSVLVIFAVSTLTLLAALTVPGRWGLLLVVPMAVAAVAALTRILPRGTFMARRGLPAVIASGFLANAAFFSVEGFLPAYLTRVAGLTLTVASIVVTCGVLSWTIGTWAQSRLANSRPMARIATLGEALMLVGVGGVVAGVASGAAIVVYVAWGLAGLGMGMTYPAIGVLATDVAATGDAEVTTLAQYQLGDVLGSGFGPALVGIAVNAAASRSIDLQDGLLIGFSATCALLLAALFASTRLPATSSTRAESPARRI
jgi:MFS family permease